MISIRPATEEDAPRLLAMAKAMHAESPRYHGIPFSIVRVDALLQTLIGHPNVGCVLVAERDGEILGTMWGYLSNYFFSEALHASDILVYVCPEHRGSRAVVRLVQAFEAWGGEHGAVNIQVGVSTGIDNARGAGLYERLGYNTTGIALSKAVVDVCGP